MGWRFPVSTGVIAAGTVPIPGVAVRVAPLIYIVVLASACGYSEKKFQVETIPEFCSLNANCTEIIDAVACIDSLRTVDRSTCDYDPKAAKECQQLLEEATCEDNGDIGTYSLLYPESCDRVYDGCGVLWEEPFGVVTE
jgi:hypothetical protein